MRALMAEMNCCRTVCGKQEVAKEACIFNQAALLPEVFCGNPDRLAAACAQPRSRGHIKRLLLALTPEYQRLALERVPEDFCGYFEAELAKPWVCVGMNGERCTFALAARGGPAQVRGRSARCLFCRPEDLWPLCAEEAGKREAGPPDKVSFVLFCAIFVA